MWDAFITFMINILLYIYNLVGQNFGLAIILFTILVRLLMYPLTARQVKSSKAMQDLQKSKKWQDIQEKYKDDKEKLAQKQMEVYQEMGISPFGSCLPLLLQFPIIIGLYQAIIRTLAVTPVQLVNLSKHINDGAQLIPINSQFLWMELSEPERLQIFGLGVPILAILVVITSYIQTKMVSTSAPGDDGGQGAQMSKAMSLYMPFFMGYLALTFASGLALYFIATNLTTIAQYVILGQGDFKNLIPNFSSS
ncbi:MAG: membrane protein insertase YidC [Anaerolineales bacterium]|nr:membrane protein insertase YidC [Anaerolineales bacterium]MBS3751854.1 membrane protein insertase YidC [Anaerolineales bacterium]